MIDIESYKVLRTEIGKKLSILQENLELKAWDFYINSSDENLKLYTEAQEQFSKFFQDKGLYEQLKSYKTLDTNDKHITKQINDLIKAFYNEIDSGNELKALRDKENKIASKYNSFVLKIDGKPVTKAEISKILEAEKDIKLREKAYLANVESGDYIAQDLIELVKMRNEYAIKKGYDNYFSYMLEESYDITENKLNKLLDGVYNKTKEKNILFDREVKEKLSKEYSISIEDLRDYHYGLLTGETPEKRVNECFKTKEQIVDIAIKTYNNMGYDIEKMGITLDLFPREKKNTHGFAFCIKPGKDARILANLTNNLRSLDTILHELGHCVYDIGIDTKLPFVEQECVSPAMTEAIAMMMGDLPYSEDILSNIISVELLNELKEGLRKEDAKFVLRSMQIIMFEKELYKNPNQDLKALWKNIKIKYRFRDENTFADNEWATIPHYLSHPGYYQNYFRAALLKVQIYNKMIDDLGQITTNIATSKWLNEKLFSLGSSKLEDEIIKNITGKTLMENDFCNRILK